MQQGPLLNVFKRIFLKTFKIQAILFILVFLIAAACYGEELKKDTGKVKKVTIDTNYIKPYNKNCIIKGWVDYKVISLSMTPLNMGSMLEKSIIYIPNVSTSMGLAASYKFITLSYSFKIPYTTRKADKYGSSTYRDFKFTFTKQKFIASGIFRQYKGFYIENTTSLFTSWFENNQRPQRPDIQYTYLGMEGFWIFNNRKFSSDAFFTQKDIQYKSAFSLLAMGDLGITQLKGDTVLIPAETGYSGELSDVSKMMFYSIDASIGATVSWVIGHRVYISPILFGGFGLQLKQYHKPEDDLLKVRLLYRINFRLSMGYNSKNFFGGLFIETENMIMPDKNIFMMSNVLAINGFLGVKFNAFKNVHLKPKRAKN